LEKLKACLLCGADAGRAARVHRRQGHALVRCPICGLLYANPQFTESELAELYHRLYYDEQHLLLSSTPEAEHARNRILYRTVLRDLLARYPRLAPSADGPPPRVLDFGCGPGFFLAECRTIGLAASGIEFSPIAARYAREKLQLDAKAHPRTALAELPSRHYDLITAWEVIEHLRRPRETLQRLCRSLAPQGVLCLTTPSLNCWRYRLERGRWFNIRNPTHLAFFDRHNLTRLLRECSLVNVIRPVFWGGRPGFGQVANLAQYLVRIAGIGSDLRLYAERPAEEAAGQNPLEPTPAS
jgi:2-polyprenyl-3-methyl-5-hydroxy-6-metoxy-1,4-benzoquinol methylase